MAAFLKKAQRQLAEDKALATSLYAELEPYMVTDLSGKGCVCPDGDIPVLFLSGDHHAGGYHRNGRYVRDLPAGRGGPPTAGAGYVLYDRKLITGRIRRRWEVAEAAVNSKKR